MSTLSPLLFQTPWILLSVFLVLLFAQENLATLREQPAEEVGLEAESLGGNAMRLTNSESERSAARPSIDRQQTVSFSDRDEHFSQKNSPAIQRFFTFLASLSAILVLCYAFQPLNASQTEHSRSVRVPPLPLDAFNVPADVSTSENDKDTAPALEDVGTGVFAGSGTDESLVALRGGEGADAAALAAAGAYLYFKLELLANHCLLILPLLPDSLQPSILRNTMVFGLLELSVLSVLYAGELEADRQRTFEAFMRLEEESCQRLSAEQIKGNSIHELSAMLGQLWQLHVRPISALELHSRLLETCLPSSEQAIVHFSAMLDTLMGCVRRTGFVSEDMSSSIKSVLAAVSTQRLQQILEVPEVAAPLIACFDRLPLASGTVEQQHSSLVQTERSASTKGAEDGQNESSAWTMPDKSQQSTAAASPSSEPKIREPLVQKGTVEKVQQLQPSDVPLEAAEAGIPQSAKPWQSFSEEPAHFLMRPIEPAPQVSQEIPLQITLRFVGTLLIRRLQVFQGFEGQEIVFLIFL
ncbi:hypothetical protein Esti_000124 [Eimeria stiedai]